MTVLLRFGQLKLAKTLLYICISVIQGLTIPPQTRPKRLIFIPAKWLFRHVNSTSLACAKRNENLWYIYVSLYRQGDFLHKYPKISVCIISRLSFESRRKNICLSDLAFFFRS